MTRLAWFSPFPPSTSGIAAYSAELVPLLRARGLTLDVFAEDNARDFVWQQRRTPYALTVFQLGNAACHDYMWAYLFRYPGMVVLHDAQIHQARASFLTKRWKPRRADYLAEFRASHPDAPADVGELIVAGLGGVLYQHWPLNRLVVESARLTVVHNERLAADLLTQYPTAAVTAIHMGVADPMAAATSVPTTSVPPTSVPPTSVPADAIVLAAFGGVTPEKRISQLLRAVSAVAARHPRLHVLLVGATANHYDVMADARRNGVSDRVHVTGYVDDADLPGYLHAADICACLRWPSNRETSASWLRCLAAGRPTLITDLADHADVPTLDPRGWAVLDSQAPSREPVAVSIDILDEEHSLQLALDTLATDRALRERLGRAARRWFESHHQLGAMADAYQRCIAEAVAAAAPAVDPPAHLTSDGGDLVQTLTDRFGVESRLGDLFRR
ncbi:MAG TPA: glycosyltransferase family 4 protein [Vicinamibacterales bacterium]|nr:glycosyltransferase family 4 protein [Vicinamibacterales bacterium]